MPRLDTALRLAGSLGVALDDLVAGLEWRPGYEIVVQGSWEVVERNGTGAVPANDSAAEMPVTSR
jgi:hypothetical protein